MKKFAALMLGLALTFGTVAIAQEKGGDTKTEQPKKEKKAKKAAKKKSDDKKEETK